MGLFQHPHLTRGLVKTAKGAFNVSRGLVEMPDEIGESLGWRPVGQHDDPAVAASLSPSPERLEPDQYPASALSNDAHMEQETQSVHQGAGKLRGPRNSRT